MNIWIVEDNETDALKAAKAVLWALDATPEISRSATQLYWDPTLHWEPHLQRIPIAHAEPRLSDGISIPKLTREAAPTIVILDLFDKGLSFEAENFFLALRTWEVKQHLCSSFVIIWSVHSGKPEVRNFVEREPQRDWRVKFLGTKYEDTLARAVRGYLHTEVELKHQ